MSAFLCAVANNRNYSADNGIRKEFIVGAERCLGLLLCLEALALCKLLGYRFFHEAPDKSVTIPRSMFSLYQKQLPLVKPVVAAKKTVLQC